MEIPLDTGVSMKTPGSPTLQSYLPSFLHKSTLTGLFVLVSVIEARSNPLPTFRQYCFQCHGNAASMAGVNLEQMVSQSSISDSFKQWRNVMAALEQKRMPPEM